MKMLTVATPPCIICGNQAEFRLTKDRYERWIRGGLAQNVFPEYDVETREQLISGTCPGKCQAELFGGTDDEG